MTFIEKLDNYLAAMEKAVVVLLFSALAGSIVINVLMRNIFHISFHRILEFSPAFVLWLALVGSSLAIKDNRHIKIEILLRFVSKKFSSVASKITSIFGMVVMGILFYASLGFVINEISLFGIKGSVTFIFPWFFLISFFRFFLKLNNRTYPIKSIEISEDSI